MYLMSIQCWNMAGTCLYPRAKPIFYFVIMGRKEYIFMKIKSAVLSKRSVPTPADFKSEMGLRHLK